MPVPTPFHNRTAALCESNEWRDWSGFLAAATYEPSHEREYYAIRNSAGLIDVSPLYKYDISGPESLQVVNKIVTRDMSACGVGQIMYSPWAADPSLRWFQDCGFGLEATVSDRSRDLVVLALQGPMSRTVLKAVFPAAETESIGYYRLGTGNLKISQRITAEVTITRTGYTGDLGYELWTEATHAEPLWDRLVDIGQSYGLLPVGMVALDIARIEAGLLLIEVDYISSQKALIEARKSSPYETGLGWTVALHKGPFVGRRALIRERETGSGWALVGLEIDWLDLEKRFAAVDLPPMVAGRASRDSAPVYDGRGRQVGQLTSRTFSPVLKKYIGLATVRREYNRPGTRLRVEVTVEFAREMVDSRVVDLPFYDPPHKRG
jgi:aminomethyltransferase